MYLAWSSVHGLHSSYHTPNTQSTPCANPMSSYSSAAVRTTPRHRTMSTAPLFTGVVLGVSVAGVVVRRTLPRKVRIRISKIKANKQSSYIGVAVVVRAIGVGVVVRVGVGGTGTVVAGAVVVALFSQSDVVRSNKAMEFSTYLAVGARGLVAVATAAGAGGAGAGGGSFGHGGGGLVY